MEGFLNQKRFFSFNWYKMIIKVTLKIPTFPSRKNYYTENSYPEKFWEFSSPQKLINPKNLDFGILENKL